MPLGVAIVAVDVLLRTTNVDAVAIAVSVPQIGPVLPPFLSTVLELLLHPQASTANQPKPHAIRIDIKEKPFQS